MQGRHPEDTESEAAREGTAAHEIAELMLDAGTRGQKATLPEIASNGVPITEEMLEAATLYADHCVAIMRRHGVFGGDYLGIEREVPITCINPENGGTPDFWLYAAEANILYVRDFKFGFGYVDEWENWQMIDYTAGLLADLDIDGALDQMTTVSLGIVQPRTYGAEGVIREWRVRASELRSYFNVLHVNGAEALKDNAPTVSGPHCRYCSARHACESAQRAAYTAIEHTGKSLPVELDPLALGIELGVMQRAAKAIEYRLEGLKAQAENVARSGTPVPGWELKDATGRKGWAKSHDEVVMLGTLYDIELTKPALITPNQATKAGLDPEVLAAYTETPITGVKLMESNPRRVFK